MAKIIKSTCENIIIPVSKKTKTDIPILKINKKNTVPNLETVLLIERLALLNVSISTITISSLSSPLLVSGLVESKLSTRSAPSESTSVVPYWSNNHGCFTCTENKLSRIISTLSLPLLLVSGMTIFVPTSRADVLISFEKSLMLPI